jgi:hypothetical protein
VNLKAILGWAIVVFIAYYLFTKPTGAAAAMQGLFHVLSQAGVNLAKFLKNA